MSIAKNTKETFLEEIIDNLSGNTRELPVDCKPRTREEVLLAEIEKNTRELKNDEPINIDLSNYYTKEETNNLVEEQTNSVINDSNTSSTNTWSSQKIVDYVATVDDVIFEEANGSVVTVNNSVEGYLKNIEILGNTIQDIENLADIRSVGDTVEGQELYEIPVLSRGKNLLNSKMELGTISGGLINTSSTNQIRTVDFVRLKPNTDYVISGIPNYTVFFCTKNCEYITEVGRQGGTKFTTPENCEYIKFRTYSSDNITNINTNIQLEEGTQATPYEPYQEDKLTILSPTPLEKVGDVADRIIEKDGVWGVEKNVGTQILDGNEGWGSSGTIGEFTVFGHNPGSSIRVYLCDKFKVYPNKDITHEGVSEGFGQFQHADFYEWRVCISNSKLSSVDVTGFKTWLRNNPTLVKYEAKLPQFIPLPHSQQVKLRTFANKTNISFGCEIEGTIKAQVPKSLGATVNTHTEQISNLNKELDRVKKLEESVTTKVETESDFTVVEQTSNGYFEDVELEGRTLVNLGGKINGVKNRYALLKSSIKELSPNQLYTFILKNNTNTVLSFYASEHNFTYSEWITVNANSTLVKLFKTKDVVGNKELIKSASADGTTFDLDLMILEGDHTQNPPSYFEGLKSVGQGTDEIVVSSVKGDNLKTIEYSSIAYNSDHILATFKYVIKGNVYIHNHSNKPIYIPCRKSSWTRNLLVPPNSSIYTSLELPDEVLYAVRLLHSDGWKDAKLNLNAILSISNEPINRDKKRLLFYNNETQTWEQPVLREWDSIEKHSDGKYYYHQRSGEVVLNGSENWIVSGYTNQVNCMSFDLFLETTGDSQDMRIESISDILRSSLNNTLDEEMVFMKNHYSRRRLIITKVNRTKLSTQDVAGFKQWLQTNNVTVVYQLAEEKVYECTNIDLITYEGETNYIVESGAISPKTTLKVHNNISNVVSLLQKKVSILESNMTKYMITQNRMQLASTYSADSVTFKVDYALCSEEVESYNEDLYNLILHNILVGKDNYDYDKMFNLILDYVTWGQLSFENFDTLVGLMDIQHNPPIDEEVTEEI